MTSISYIVKASPDEGADESHYTHHQPLQVGDVIQITVEYLPRGWYRVVSLQSQNGVRTAQLSQRAESEALAHHPKATPR